MKLSIQIQLKPSTQQALLLSETLQRCNSACDHISRTGWDAETLRQYDLHKLVYKDVRERFDLSAQVSVRCIAKVADTYKADCKARHTFSKYAAQPYDDRIFRFCSDTLVSIWTLAGRQKIEYVCGEKQRELLKYRKGEVDLMFVRKKWYLSVCCDIPEPDDIEALDVLGVDFGIVNLATDSNGVKYSGEKVEKQRRIMKHRRRNLQRKGTRSATRKLKKLSSKQSRYQKDVNHCISKAIVQTAQRYSSAIALEQLEGITKRVKASRRQRAKLHNWAFAQLRAFITYKAKMLGIPVILVDPRNTSRTCPDCGVIDKKNRKTQADFQCIGCGHAGHADHIAARNIRARAFVNKPMVAGDLQCLVAS
jgi:IS605 OrfB family transposase